MVLISFRHSRERRGRGLPYTGFDPREPGDPIDPSGGGLDPSAYWGQSPGGRFPGDVQNYLDYLYGLSQGTAGGNPDYDIPDWIQRLLPGRLGQAANFHERNVREGGVGQPPGLPAGFPHQLYSGPAARFGPPGGDLHGLLDIGREHGFWDGPDAPGAGQQPTGKKPRGGGGGGGGHFTFTPPPQMNYTPSFVDWQPIAPFTQGGGETRLTGPARTVTPGKAPETPKPGKQPKLPKQPAGGAGGRGGGQGGRPIDPGTAGRPLGGGQRPGGPGAPPTGFDEFMRWLTEHGGGATPGERGPAAFANAVRTGFGAGVNFNDLFRGSPGWVEDDVLNIRNTGGMPLPTLPAPRPGESQADYMNRVSDLGYGPDTLSSILGPYGFSQRPQVGPEGPEQGYEWGWGTGPVMRDDEGYRFANQGRERPGIDEGRPMFGGGHSSLMDLIMGSSVFAR